MRKKMLLDSLCVPAEFGTNMLWQLSWPVIFRGRPTDVQQNAQRAPEGGRRPPRPAGLFLLGNCVILFVSCRARHFGSPPLLALLRDRRLVLISDPRCPFLGLLVLFHFEAVHEQVEFICGLLRECLCDLFCWVGWQCGMASITSRSLRFWPSRGSRRFTCVSLGPFPATLHGFRPSQSSTSRRADSERVVTCSLVARPLE